jgi:hypothetical protein
MEASMSGDTDGSIIEIDEVSNNSSISPTVPQDKPRIDELRYGHHKRGRQETRARALAGGHHLSPFSAVSPGAVLSNAPDSTSHRTFAAWCGRCRAYLVDDWTTKTISGTAMANRCR